MASETALAELVTASEVAAELDDATDVTEPPAPCKSWLCKNLLPAEFQSVFFSKL